MNILYLIPARADSKGIPNKNIKSLRGKPLIYYTLEAAQQVADDRDICVSTDSKKIKLQIEDYGIEVPFLRPASLATDDSRIEDVIDHALNFFKQRALFYDVVILLQPTSPLRKGIHIKEALSLYHQDIDMVVSVKKTKSNPYYVLFEEDNEGFLKNSKKESFTKRQDCPPVFELNGAIYVINVNSFVKKGFRNFDKIIKYEMEQIYSVDIDDMIDWKLCELILEDV